MKNTRRQTSHRSCPAYPNAAGSSYYLPKALDIATAIASGLGLLAALVFLAAIT